VRRGNQRIRSTEVYEALAGPGCLVRFSEGLTHTYAGRLPVEPDGQVVIAQVPGKAPIQAPANQEMAAVLGIPDSGGAGAYDEGR
jgi:hypothetical protein